MGDHKQALRRWPRDRIKPRTVARCLDLVLADLDAVRAELHAERERNAPLRARIEERSRVEQAIELWRESNIRFQRRAEAAEATRRAWRALRSGEGGEEA